MGVAYPLIEGRLHWASVRIEVTEPGFVFTQQFFMLRISQNSVRPSTPCPE
jgi:hypothetical protein